MSVVEHYSRQRTDTMAAWFPGDPEHTPGVRLCPCGAKLGAVKDATGLEWFACETEWEAIAASAKP